MTGPFTDIRVLDFSRDMAGRYAAMMMCDMGAEVVRIDSKSDEHMPNPDNRLLDRGKKSLILDLSDELGADSLNKLVKSSDVLLETWLASESKSSFLDYETISNINPLIVYCSMPPYGDTGPMAEIPGDDGTLSTFTGIHEGQGGETGTPFFVRLPLVSYGTAFTACLAVSAALVERISSGMGQKVEVPLYSGSVVMQTTSLIKGENVPVPRKRPANASGGLPTYRLYRCSDGWIFMACGNNVFWNKLCIALDLYELLEDERFAAAPWGISIDDWPVLSNILEPMFESNTQKYWLTVLQNNDVPCGPAETREWFSNHPQVLHNRMLVEVDDPLLGKTIQPSPPIFMSASPPKIQGPAPIPGEHSKNLPEKSKTPIPFRKFLSHPLEGVKIVDLTGYIAGSFGTTLLSDLGAEVTKVESFAGDGFRQNSVAFQGWNRGKRGIILNLKTPKGLQIFHSLVEKADIVAENFRGGIAAKLKVDYESLRKINPKIIYCTVTGYGSDGPSSNLPTFDPLIQAQGGAMRDQGGDSDPVFLRVPASDYSSAILSAFGMVSALYHRQLHNVGQRIEVSLVNAAFAYQALEYFQYEGKPDAGRIGTVGHSSDYRLYKASDGWLFLSCKHPADWKRMCLAINRGDLVRYSDRTMRAASDEYLNSEIGTIIGERAVRDWVGTFRASHVKCAANRSINLIHDDPQANQLGLITENHAFDLGKINLMGLPFKFSRTPGRLELPAPSHGQHTDSVLQSLGYGQTSIAKMRSQGIIG